VGAKRALLEERFELPEVFRTALQQEYVGYQSSIDKPTKSHADHLLVIIGQAETNTDCQVYLNEQESTKLPLLENTISSQSPLLFIFHLSYN
jgi:hypothetical protein